MARRKQSEELESDCEAAWETADFVEFLEPFAPSAEELGPLAGEVQSFLDKRLDLARKLAQEIDTTEKKLAELKRTAAALFPEATAESELERDGPERKVKKPAPKSVKLAHQEPAETAAPSTEETPAVSADGTSQTPASSGESEPVAQVA